jgi:predicted phage terminase large subunit-like protein
MSAKKISEDNSESELEKLLLLRRLEAVDHHLNFMSYTWQNHSEPFTIGYHTRKICAAIDYAMELYRDGKSSAWVITVPFRHGKALEVNTLIPTPDGFRKIKDLNPGDYVYGEDGKPVRVIAKSPVWKNRNLIKVTAKSDGKTEAVFCDELHLWKCRFFNDEDYLILEAKDISKTVYINGFTLNFKKTELKGDTVCIQVENENGMFLCGKSFIPTHNSEILSRKLPAHFLGLFPDSKVILCGHTQALTEGFSKTSRNLISTPEYRKLFPNIKVDTGSSSAAHWMIKDHEGECFASGLLGSLSGQGYNLGLLDDFCRNRADAESDTMREKMWDAFTNDFMTRKAPVSITIVLATPWHVDDIIGRIKKKCKEDPDFPHFNFLKFPAMSDKYPEGVLFPERFGKQWYTQQRAVLGDYGFQSLMQLEPVKRSGNMLNTECIQRHLTTADWPKNLRWLRVWDLAHTAKERAKSDPDWTSGTLLAFNEIDGLPHLWIRNVTRMRLNAPERDEQIRHITNQDGPYVRIGVGNSSDAKDTIATMRKILKGKYTVLSVPEKKDKVVRATPLEAIFKAGNVHVVQGEPWLDDWIAEISAFPYGPHDDQVDNLSAGFAIWSSSGISNSLYTW